MSSPTLSGLTCQKKVRLSVNPLNIPINFCFCFCAFFCLWQQDILSFVGGVTLKSSTSLLHSGFTGKYLHRSQKQCFSTMLVSEAPAGFTFPFKKLKLMQVFHRLSTEIESYVTTIF